MKKCLPLCASLFNEILTNKGYWNTCRQGIYTFYTALILNTDPLMSCTVTVEFMAAVVNVAF